MIDNLFLLLIAAASFVSLRRWRAGPFMLILVGALQDPVRKLTPGAPGYLVLSTVPVWTATIAGAWASEKGLWKRFRRSQPQLATAILLFLVSLLPAAAQSATYGPGSWQLTVIGGFVYLTAIASLLVGFAYPRALGDIGNVFALFCIVTSVVLVGVPMEQMGLAGNSPALGTKSMGITWVRHSTGLFVSMISGFYRSPDIMGWHAAAAIMLAIALALRGPRNRAWFWLLIAGWGGIGAMLCARRKVVLMLPIFALVLLWGYWRTRHSRMGPVLGILTAAVLSGAVMYQHFGHSEAVERYYAKEGSTVVERVKSAGMESLVETFRQSGFLGEGLGTATQGTHHLQVKRPRTWQEGGLAKLLVELGVPGLATSLILGAALLLSVVRATGRLNPAAPEFPLCIGILAMMLANAGGFVVSHQVLGDPFINCFFSFLMGAALSDAPGSKRGTPAAKAA